MKNLSLEETKSMQGGISFWGCVGIVSAVLFSIGIFDGFTRPVKCN